MLARLARWLPARFFGPKPPADLSWITPELAQSAEFSARSAPALAQLEIGAVLDLRPDRRHELEPIGRAGLHYFHLPAADPAGPAQDDMKRAADWVLQELRDDRKVLIHHVPSSGHSPVMVAAVVLRIGYPLEDALTRVRGASEYAFSEAQQSAIQRFADGLAR